MRCRTAVYCGTRNLYWDMATAVESLLAHNGADKVILVIEDDEFPYGVPNCCRAINVRGQQWFVTDGPNYNGMLTYMVLMRAALTKILPEEDVVLSLDVDTIVDGDISGLWDCDIGDNYLMATRETAHSESGLYIQMGVAMLNLKKLREDRMDDRIIKALNTKKYLYAEQDCINELCAGRIKELDSRYNANDYTLPTENPVIYHYAGILKWNDAPKVAEYRTKRDSRMRVMIHACPKRMWYVEGYLIPKLKEQGIEDIVLWNDSEGKGNLISCMESFEWCGAHPKDGSTVHIQDDVVPSLKFAEMAARAGREVVCGICPANTLNCNRRGIVRPKKMWWSFPCIKISDRLAGECAEWFHSGERQDDEFRERVLSGMYDDWFFMEFLKEKYPDMEVLNASPHFVDHIAEFIGGSTLTPGVRFRANDFVDRGEVDNLKEWLRGRDNGL